MPVLTTSDGALAIARPANDRCPEPQRFGGRGARPPRALWLAPPPATFVNGQSGTPFSDSARASLTRRGRRVRAPEAGAVPPRQLHGSGSAGGILPTSGHLQMAGAGAGFFPESFAALMRTRSEERRAGK